MDWKEKKHYTDLPEDIRKDVKTVRQWALEGFIPVSEGAGKDMYANRFRYYGTYHYFHRSEVRTATSKELEAIFAPEKARRNELAKKRSERRKKMDAKMNKIANTTTSVSLLAHNR